MSWPAENPPRKPPRAKPPVRSTIRQWGYRINETGVERWFYADLRYGGPGGGGNGATKEQVEKAAVTACEAAAEVGLTVTFTLLYRDHLTTSWSRWLQVREVQP